MRLISMLNSNLTDDVIFSRSTENLSSFTEVTKKQKRKKRPVEEHQQQQQQPLQQRNGHRNGQQQQGISLTIIIPD